MSKEKIMRVTRESLIKIARETAQERAYNDKDIIAAYLTGSLVEDQLDPILVATLPVEVVPAEDPRRPCDPRT